MSSSANGSPQIVPVLSAGRHRSPRKGACFMEFASYLAGERWSDHPACTHPALAFLARMVNDCTSDDARSELTELIPSVIGLTGDDSRVDVVIALRAGAIALPIASEERQRALAVGILACQERLERLGGAPSRDLNARVASAFVQAPHAERWARQFIADSPAAAGDRAAARMTESVIRIAVLGIAQACAPGSDDRLRNVLAGAIEDCTALLRPARAKSAVAPREPVAVA